MASSDDIVGVVMQGDSPLLSRRVTCNVGGVETPVTQAMLAGITYRVYDSQSGEVTDGAQTLDVSSVIDDTPPTSGLLDDMNFSFQLNDVLDRGSRRYTVDVEFELTGATTFTRRWVLGTKNRVG